MVLHLIETREKVGLKIHVKKKKKKKNKKQKKNHPVLLLKLDE